MDRSAHYFPLARPLMALLLGLLILLVVLVQIGALSYAYGELGITAPATFALLAAELAGSAVNVPVAWMRSTPTVVVRRVVAFGVVYLVPEVARPRQTLIAINVGGAVIPSAVCAYVLVHTAAWPATAAATAAVIIGVKLVARPVPGLGIAVPGMYPAALAAISAMVLASSADAAAVAYVSGTAGTLVGADILNLHRVRELGAPVVSIGGAGTFDGIFITGIVAVVLVSISL